MTHRFLPPFAAALLVLAAATVSATTIVVDDNDALARLSDEIVVGEVVAVDTELREGRVVTLVTIAPERRYVDADGGDLVVVVPGGRTDTLATWVPGADRYTLGEQVLVFLDAIGDGTFVSPALSFSKFTLVDSDAGLLAVREPSGLHMVPPSPELRATPTVEAALPPEVERNVFELFEIEQSIANALEAR